MNPPAVGAFDGAVSVWDGLLTLVGHSHPLVLHLPIGIVIALAALELLSRRQDLARVRTTLALLLAASAVASALTGLALSAEEGDSETLLWHKYLALGFAATCVLTAIVAWRGRMPGAYRGLLTLSVLLVLPAGHLGASITHGADFVTGPLRALFSGNIATPNGADAAGADGTAADPRVAADYEHVIAPVFAANCVTCHGVTRQRAQLALNTPEGIARGGKHGPVFVAGQPEQSDLLRRMRLPPEDEDHMPPAEKPQPAASEVEAVAAWIVAGAPFTGDVPALRKFAAAAPVVAPTPGADAVPPGAPESRQPALASSVTTPPRSPAPAPAEATALDALRAALVHVEPVAADSPLLWIDFAAAAGATTDASAVALLEPVREQAAELSLARCAVGDALAPLFVRMPRLARLDLQGTQFTTQGLAALAGHASLAELVLARTPLDDEALVALLALPALRSVRLWQAGLDAAAIARLREARPDLDVDAGDRGAAPALETEAPVVVVARVVPAADAATVAAAPVATATQPAGSPATAAPVASLVGQLAAVNTLCPVSGRAVSSAFRIVDQNRVIGFCCRDCVATFLADPETHRAAVK